MLSTYCVALHRSRVFVAALMTLAATAGICGVGAARATPQLPTVPKVRYQISGPLWPNTSRTRPTPVSAKRPT